MKEPKRIPLNPETPKQKTVKTYPLPPLYPESINDDLFSSKDLAELKKIHNDFFVQDTIKNIKKNYENNSESS